MNLVSSFYFWHQQIPFHCELNCFILSLCVLSDSPNLPVALSHNNVSIQRCKRWTVWFLNSVSMVLLKQICVLLKCTKNEPINSTKLMLVFEQNIKLQFHGSEWESGGNKVYMKHTGGGRIINNLIWTCLVMSVVCTSEPKCRVG